MKSAAFKRVVGWYVDYLSKHDLLLLKSLNGNIARKSTVVDLVKLLVGLENAPLSELARVSPGLKIYLKKRELLHEFAEGLYNFWRSYGRFLVCHFDPEARSGYEEKPYRTFNQTVEQLTHIVRSAYRDICENITGDHPRVYRQVSAGCEVGLIVTPKSWPAPKGLYSKLKNTSFIRQVWIHPPLIIDPPMNKRTGQFQRIYENPLKYISPDEGKWFCYPARVGHLVIFIYFHQSVIGLGCALSNLFELAGDEQIAEGPDAVYFYGASPESLARFGKMPTVFYDDEPNRILLAAVPAGDEFGYFGYLKKMVLTLHNIIMLKQGRMPYHGAMFRIILKDDTRANILMMGDTATGKSELLEAFRTLGRDYIQELRIIADDMGSLEIKPNRTIAGYGTEIGAFVRLDDLQPGFAFGQMDRSIFMSPQKINARVVLPVTTMEEVLRGYELTMLFYANNYESVDDNHPVIERFSNAEEALKVFREGAALSKGTTTATGLVHTYFANIFGPPQYRTLHEKIARRTFKAAFDSGVFVGQIRTRLGIAGCETKGPRAAAQALFELIRERTLLETSVYAK
ncbi:MAG: phosphoenolpyruvate carboxykinase [Planctomycetes bacterium]|nr:phosphoenolpyruvate carboxykinase [Planctomycetota bacterium]